MKRLYSLKRFGSLLGLAGVLAAILLLPGCQSCESDIAREIKQESGLDVNSPAQVGAAALGASVIGNDEQSNAIDAFKGYQRARHEKAGDDAMHDAGTQKARDEYNKALQWSDTDTDADKGKTAALYGRIAYTYEREGFSIGASASVINDPVASADLYRLAAEKMRMSASWNRKAAHIAPTDKSAYLGIADVRDSSAEFYLQQARKLAGNK